MKLVHFRLSARWLLLPSSLFLVSIGGCGGTAASAESPEPAAQSSTSDAPPARNLPKAVNAGQTPRNPLLDDLEDGNHQLVQAEMRGGYWYTYADPSSKVEPTGTFAPAPGGASGSAFAARMHGTVGDAEYPYVGIGFSLFEPKGPYDLTKCKGVSFKAKKGTPESTGMLRLKVGDVNTVPEGGVCKSCYNDFGRDVLLTEEWSEITALFYEMRQEPYWGEPQPTIDASRVYQLQWQVKDKGQPFDIWIDDVKLVGCAE